MFPACHLSKKLSSARQKWYLHVFPTHLSAKRRNIGRYTSPLVFKNNLESQVTFFWRTTVKALRNELLTALCTKILGKEVCNSVELQSLICNIYFTGQLLHPFKKKYFYQREISRFITKWLIEYLWFIRNSWMNACTSIYSNSQQHWSQHFSSSFH